MLYGLGPGELILCLIPLFLIMLFTFVLLIGVNRRTRSNDEGNDE